MTFVLNCPEPPENTNESVLIIAIIKENWCDRLRRAAGILIGRRCLSARMSLSFPCLLSSHKRYSMGKGDRSGMAVSLQSQEGSEEHNCGISILKGTAWIKILQGCPYRLFSRIFDTTRGFSYSPLCLNCTLHSKKVGRRGMAFHSLLTCKLLT